MGFTGPALGTAGTVGAGVGGSAAGGSLLEGLQSFTGAVANPFATLTGGSEIGQALDMLNQISNPAQMTQLAPLPQSQVFAVPKRLRRRLGQ